MSSRAKVVLPEADGPTTASTWPGVMENCMPRTMTVWEPGAPATSPSTTTAPSGAGSAMLGDRLGSCPSNCSSRVQASRTPTTARHCETTCTKGASMRPPKTDAMIIIPAPPLSLPPNSSQAPSPSNNDPITCCTNLEMA